MYVERFIAKEWIIPLKLLGGRTNPFGITVDPKVGIQIPPNPPPLLPTPAERKAYTPENASKAKHLLRGIAALGYPSSLMILSKCIADGLKVFRPTFAEMIAGNGQLSGKFGRRGRPRGFRQGIEDFRAMTKFFFHGEVPGDGGNAPGNDEGIVCR